MSNWQIASLPFLGAEIALICTDIHYNYFVNLDIPIWVLFGIVVLFNICAILKYKNSIVE